MANQNTAPNTDDQKIANLKAKINNPVAAATTPETDKVEEKAEKIEILEPETFPVHEQHGYIRNAVLANKISSLFSEVFADFQTSSVFWNPAPEAQAFTCSGIGCKIRFKFATKDELEAKPDAKDKVIAVDTAASQIQAASSFDRVMKQVNLFNNPQQRGERYATLTNKAKSLLSDFVIRTKDNKIDWNVAVSTTSTGTRDFSGRAINVIYVDVYLDIQKILYKIFSGTDKCPNFKNNKYYSYTLQFVAATNSPVIINGTPQSVMTDFILRLIRSDQRQMKKFCEESNFGAIPMVL
jgi:hypothetical protein